MRACRAIASISKSTAAPIPGTASGGSNPDKRVSASCGHSTPRAAYTRCSTGCTLPSQPCGLPGKVRRTMFKERSAGTDMARGCGNHRETTSGSSRATASENAHGNSGLVLHAYDVVAAPAAGRVEFERIALALADQRARDRRGHRDAAMFDIGFQIADDLINKSGAAVFVLQFHGGTEHHASARIEPRDVDDFRMRQAGFQFLDAAFQEALLLARGVVFGVLAQIAVCARLRDRRDDARAFHGFQPFQF